MKNYNLSNYKVRPTNSIHYLFKSNRQLLYLFMALVTSLSMGCKKNPKEVSSNQDECKVVRMTSTSFSGQHTNIEYEAKGRISKVSNGEESISFTYKPEEIIVQHPSKTNVYKLSNGRITEHGFRNSDGSSAIYTFNYNSQGYLQKYSSTISYAANDQTFSQTRNINYEYKGGNLHTIKEDDYPSQVLYYYDLTKKNTFNILAGRNVFPDYFDDDRMLLYAQGFFGTLSSNLLLKVTAKESPNHQEEELFRLDYLFDEKGKIIELVFSDHDSNDNNRIRFHYDCD